MPQLYRGRRLAEQKACDLVEVKFRHVFILIGEWLEASSAAVQG